MAGFVGPDDAVTNNDFVGPDAPMAADPMGGKDVTPPPTTAAEDLASEKSPNYPTAAMTDATVPDAMMLQGVGGLAKNALGAGVRGVGAALDAVPLTKNIVPSVEDAANDALLKSIGTSAGQIKQAGKVLPIGAALDQARETAQVGRQAGLDDIFSTERGRTANLQNLINDQGRKIGALRVKPGVASPGVLDSVERDLMAKYNPANADVLSGETGDIEKGINTIKNANKPAIGPSAPLSNADIAKGITKLNKYNAGAKALQPVNALTEVANEASKANNADIMSKLSPEDQIAYMKSLKNEAAGFHLAPMIERGLNREAVARVGGKGFLQNALQKGMDAGGYRAASKGLDALHGALTEPLAATPIAKNALEAYLADKKENDNQ